MHQEIDKTTRYGKMNVDGSPKAYQLNIFYQNSYNFQVKGIFQNIFGASQDST